MRYNYKDAEVPQPGDFLWINIPVLVRDKDGDKYEVEVVDKDFLELPVCQALDLDFAKTPMHPAQSWRDYDPGDIVLDAEERVFTKCAPSADDQGTHCWIFGDHHSSMGGPEPVGRLTLLWDNPHGQVTGLGEEC